MSNRHDDDSRSEDHAKKGESKSRYADAPYTVGKGKPPSQHQFKAGGKPGPGRPRQSRNRLPFDKLLEERVVVGEDRMGRPIRKSWRAVIDRRLMQEAAKGEPWAVKLVKEFELKMADIERRYGPPPLTAGELIRKVEEDKFREENERKIKRLVANCLNFTIQLKKYGLITINEDGSIKFSKKAFQLFRYLYEGDEDGPLGPAFGELGPSISQADECWSRAVD